MLTVTSPAKALLRAIDFKDDGVLRLDPLEGGRLGFVSGTPQPDDQVVEDEAPGQELLDLAAPVSSTTTATAWIGSRPPRVLA